MLCAIDFTNLHSILRSLYDEMMPLCSDMAGVAQGIAGLGALFYVAYRIWQSLANASPIDVFPLLRPFVIGFCIMFFPTVVLGTINSVMSPIVQGAASVLEGQTLDMKKYREEKDRLEYEQMMRDPSTAYLVDDAEFRELLEMLFQAASLTIDTIRTFFLIVLAILGPISFALSVWDGFHNTLVQWICRYIQTYLWLPVADLFSTILAKIQVLMLQNDISELTNNPNVDLDGSNTAYTIFMIIGIIGYFTIPTVAGWIIQAGGMGSYNRSINNTAMTGGSWAGSIAGGVAGNVVGRAGKLLK